VNAPTALSVALLRACGVDPMQCRSVRYAHDVGSSPTLTVELTTWNADTNEFDNVTVEMVPKDAS
jgi:hypothetical protein